MSRYNSSIVKTLGYGKELWKLYKNEPPLKRIASILYVLDIFDPIFNVYYSLSAFFNNIKRLINYTPIIWRHRNWDYSYILRINQKLHEDLYDGIYKNGHHVFSERDARKLKTVINLYKRLANEEYERWIYDYFEKKYGQLDLYFKTIPDTENKPGGPYSTLHSSREDRMDKETKKQYERERKMAYEHSDKQMKQDYELLGKMIAKYSHKWWD